MKQQHEEDVKKRLYKTLFATVLVMSGVFITLQFFAPGIGSFLRFVSKIGKPAEKDDSNPPSVPYFYNVPTVTNKTSISIKGFSEPGSKVTIFVNGPQAGTVEANSEGTFAFENVSLIEGRNSIFAKAEDASQNQSDKSQTLEIAYDNKKPQITVTEPKNDTTVRNLNQRIMVKGTLDEKCEVKINDKLAVVSSSNTFELLLGVSEGPVEIKVEATDEAGNKSDETIKIKYVKAGI